MKNKNYFYFRSTEDDRHEDEDFQNDLLLKTLGALLQMQEQLPAVINPEALLRLEFCRQALVYLTKNQNVTVKKEIGATSKFSGTVTAKGTEIVFKEPRVLAALLRLFPASDIVLYTDGKVGVSLTANDVMTLTEECFETP